MKAVTIFFVCCIIFDSLAMEVANGQAIKLLEEANQISAKMGVKESFFQKLEQACEQKEIMPTKALQVLSEELKSENRSLVAKITGFLGKNSKLDTTLKKKLEGVVGALNTTFSLLVRLETITGVDQENKALSDDEYKYIDWATKTSQLPDNNA